jgi:hypothetical protein
MSQQNSIFKFHLQEGFSPDGQAVVTEIIRAKECRRGIVRYLCQEVGMLERDQLEPSVKIHPVVIPNTGVNQNVSLAAHCAREMLLLITSIGIHARTGPI